jgi:hypothetical protein
MPAILKIGAILYTHEINFYLCLWLYLYSLRPTVQNSDNSRNPFDSFSTSFWFWWFLFGALHFTSLWQLQHYYLYTHYTPFVINGFWLIQWKLRLVNLIMNEEIYQTCFSDVVVWLSRVYIIFVLFLDRVVLLISIFYAYNVIINFFRFCFVSYRFSLLSVVC